MEQHEIIETQKKIIDTISYGVKDAVIITDPKRIITHFNKAAESLTGKNIVEVLNKKIDEVLQLSDDTGSISMDTCCPISEFDIHGTVYEGKGVKLQKNDGTENIVNVQSVKVQRGVEVNLGCIIFIEDTFAQSDLERMKLDFVSMAEHVLRTPITIIRGYISRLMNDDVKAKLAENESEWDGMNEYGQPVVSGIYFFIAERDGIIEKGKFAILW